MSEVSRPASQPASPPPSLTDTQATFGLSPPVCICLCLFLIPGLYELSLRSFRPHCVVIYEADIPLIRATELYCAELYHAHERNKAERRQRRMAAAVKQEGRCPDQTDTDGDGVDVDVMDVDNGEGEASSAGGGGGEDDAVIVGKDLKVGVGGGEGECRGEGGGR